MSRHAGRVFLTFVRSRTQRQTIKSHAFNKQTPSNMSAAITCCQVTSRFYNKDAFTVFLKATDKERNYYCYL